MIKVTLDTNVLVSATFWRGASFKIMQMIESGKIMLILSPEIIQEYTEVLQYDEIQRKISHKNLEMQMTVQKIVAMSTIVNPVEKLKVIVDDPDDDVILECAVEGGVDYIISSDKHLLKIE